MGLYPSKQRPTLWDMATVSRILNASPDDVFRVLSNGWLYCHWVVGTERILRVDDSWPAPGSRFEHRVGTGPVHARGYTECMKVRFPHLLMLDAQAFPSGRALVTLRLIPEGERTRVHLDERPTNGSVLLLRLPLLREAIRVRNREALRRLGKMVEGLAGTRAPMMDASPEWTSLVTPAPAELHT